MNEVDALAADLTIVLLAGWIAIDHGETSLQFEKYMEEAEEFAGYLYSLGYRLVDKSTNTISSVQPGIKTDQEMKETP